MRSLEDNTLLLLVIAASLAFAWILWPFFGAVLWAAVLAIVFAPLRLRLLHLMPKRQNLAALATVLIVVALVILPLTLTAVSVVREATNFQHRMQAGTWNWRSRLDNRDILDRIFSSNAFIADHEICSTRRGLLLAPLLAALPLALSQTEALAGKINPSETQVTTHDAIKWSGWINGFPPRSGEMATLYGGLDRPGPFSSS
jgi:hypothetical protein